MVDVLDISRLTCTAFDQKGRSKESYHVVRRSDLSGNIVREKGMSADWNQGRIIRTETRVSEAEGSEKG